MLTTVDQLFLKALSLSTEARADLIDRLVNSTAEAIDPEIERAHLEEIRQRIARLEAGETQLISGHQVDDSILDDTREKIEFITAVQEGLTQVRHGQVISLEEVENKLGF